jgi:hypothetical protein
VYVHNGDHHLLVSRGEEISKYDIWGRHAIN